ncbi:MAG TPA: hypothetical protein VF988_00445 [Verrucomicrobiae bacterium]
MNKTEKLIVAFLLANLALAGALHFLPPCGRPVVHTEPPPAVAPAEIVTANPQTKNIPMVEIAVPKEMPPDPASKLREWARRHTGAAIDWAAQHPDSENRDLVLVAACFEIANTNPAEAVALADQFSLTNNATLDNLGEQWARRDLDAARTWAMAKPEGEGRNQLIARVGYVWSATQPAAAAGFVVQEIPPGPAQTEAAISILHQWAMRNFADASAWVELFPDGAIHERAVNELAGIREYSLAAAAPRSSSISP